MIGKAVGVRDDLNQIEAAFLGTPLAGLPLGHGPSAPSGYSVAGLAVCVTPFLAQFEHVGLVVGPDEPNR